MENKNDVNGDTIWVLVDQPTDGDLSRYAGSMQIDAEKLGQHLQSFVSAISKSLEKCGACVGDFELAEVTIKATLSAEVGLVLVSKTGINGGIDLKFQKKH